MMTAAFLLLLFAGDTIAWAPASTRFNDEASARGVSNGGQSFSTCFADVDRDGDVDVFVTNSGSNNALYINNGAGKFTDTTAGAGLSDNGSSRGCVFADVNGDGALDLYVLDASSANHLYINDGSGRFKDVTAEAGVGDTGMGQSTCVVDFDADGDYDIFVANFKQTNVLYVNDGHGKFSDGTAAAGLTSMSPFGGFGCAWGDADGDGMPDLFVHNSGAHSKLYLNNGHGLFSDNTTTAGVAAGTGQGRAVVFADIDNDGDLDLYMVSAAEDSYLYVNDGHGKFTDGSNGAGVASNLAAQGMNVADVDGDGDLDLMVANILTPCTLYENEGQNKFSDVASKAGVDYHLFGQGVAFADIDNDGDLDMHLLSYGTPPFGKPAQDNRLLINSKNGTWIKVRPQNEHGHQTLLGAAVRLRYGSSLGGVRLVDGGSGFGSQNEYGAFFGLDLAVQKGVSKFSIDVRQPGGAWIEVTPAGGVPPNQILTPKITRNGTLVAF